MRCAPEYWIWLQAALGAGAKTAGLLGFYKTAENVYNALSLHELDALIEPAVHRKLIAVSPSESYPVQKICKERGWHIITPDCEEFPESFLVLDAIPLVLYVRGDPSLLKKQPAIGFVGTRRASIYGRRAAEELSFAVASAGALVVSGCALGIDSCAHRGALEAKGKTIGFLGTGLESDYPRENHDLREAIARNGALVSEYPPNSRVSKSNFPIRNRLIAALSLGTVVVEADRRSGALITANYAAEFGKDVFAVPGEITNSAFVGCNNLIRDGAKPVFQAMDILEEYAYEYKSIDLMKLSHLPGERAQTPEAPSGKERKQSQIKETEKSKIGKPKNTEKEKPKSNPVKETVSPPKKKELPAFLDERAKKIYTYLQENPLSDADELASNMGEAISPILASLTTLEITGLVQRNEKGKYTLI